jgi:chemotaxis family two-component system sensor kinase Cph1
VPRFVNYEIRAVCELLAEAVATRVAALQSFVQAQAELSVRRLEQRMVDAISRDGDWRTALFDSSQPLLQPVQATGAALLFEGQVLTTGEVPGTPQLREIGEWLDARPRAPVIATASLGLDEPPFAPLTPVASGLLATPVSSSPGEYLVWFRPEQIRTITWGGNPFKPVQIGLDPADLSPRRSFAQWHQLVEGTSASWTPADLAAARMIGETVSDVVLQFRSVRMLIAQDQLNQVRQQVRVSGQPVLIADAEGRILLTNEAFDRLLPRTVPSPKRVEDLASCFAEPAEVRRRIADLLLQRRAWRGEVQLVAGSRVTTPLLVRADPVFASADRVLGFVLLLTDLTERRLVETARRRLQEDIIERHRIREMRLDSKADLVYRNLLSSIVGNAQLAALEITDGADLARMPGMLESLRASVARTAQLLARLVCHRTRDPERKH